MPRQPRLTKVSIQRFMSLKSVEFEPGQLNVLIGANGAGKSNVLSLFDLVGAIVDQRLRLWMAEHGRLDRVAFGGAKQSADFEFALQFTAGIQGYQAAIAEDVSGQAYFQRESAWASGPQRVQHFSQSLGEGHPETRLSADAAAQPGGVAEWALACLSGWKRYHFHDTSVSAAVKQLQPTDDNRELRRDAGNLASFLLRLKQTAPGSLARIVDAIQSVAPFFDDFVLEPDAVRDDQIRLRWRHRDNDLYADAAMMSDGTLRFICLATALLQPSPPAVILIDEPELGLHPYAIHLLAELLQAASVDHQIIVATQSVTLLDQLELKDVLVAERVHGETTMRRLDTSALDRWVERYSLGELWQKNLIGGRPNSLT